MIIARYNNVICEVGNYSKLNQKRTINFLGFFEGTDEMLIATYKPRYPNHTFQIFMHKRKPLFREVRILIENSPEIKSQLRDYNLNKLLY